jgi:uncharacterized membrane protein YeaQ/YmgE (transglycosylase-associated protein family)
MSPGGILTTIVIGFVAGLIARAVVPGKQDLGIIATVVLGLIGSIVGNGVHDLVVNGDLEFRPGGWWASVLGAVLVLAVYVFLTGGRRHRR